MLQLLSPEARRHHASVRRGAHVGGAAQSAEPHSVDRGVAEAATERGGEAAAVGGTVVEPNVHQEGDPRLTACRSSSREVRIKVPTVFCSLF